MSSPRGYRGAETCLKAVALPRSFLSDWYQFREQGSSQGLSKNVLNMQIHIFNNKESVGHRLGVLLLSPQFPLQKICMHVQKDLKSPPQTVPSPSLQR